MTFFLSFFSLLYNLSSSFCCFCVPPSMEFLQSQTSWLWMCPPRALQGPSLHPVSARVLLAFSMGRKQKGGSSLKSGPHDGHRHVEHALCDGAWLGALWIRRSCQSSLQKVLGILASSLRSVFSNT